VWLKIGFNPLESLRYQSTNPSPTPVYPVVKCIPAKSLQSEILPVYDSPIPNDILLVELVSSIILLLVTRRLPELSTARLTYVPSSRLAAIILLTKFAILESDNNSLSCSPVCSLRFNRDVSRNTF